MEITSNIFSINYYAPNILQTNIEEEMKKYKITKRFVRMTNKGLQQNSDFQNDNGWEFCEEMKNEK